MFKFVVLVSLLGLTYSQILDVGIGIGLGKRQATIVADNDINTADNEDEDGLFGINFIGIGKNVMDTGVNAAQQAMNMGQEMMKPVKSGINDIVNQATEMASGFSGLGAISTRITRQAAMSDSADIKEQVQQKLREIHQLLKDGEIAKQGIGFLNRLKEKMNRARGQSETQVESPVDQAQPQVRITRTLH